jgi:hypothetical protein
MQEQESCPKALHYTFTLELDCVRKIYLKIDFKRKRLPINHRIASVDSATCAEAAALCIEGEQNHVRSASIPSRSMQKLPSTSGFD